MDGPPVVLRPRKFSTEKVKALHEILNDLLTRNMIRLSYSPWASVVHLVKKKSGSFRLVHNFRAINSKKKQLSYSLPRVSDLTQQIPGEAIFSSLDFKNAFWQLDVCPSEYSLHFALIEEILITTSFHTASLMQATAFNGLLIM